MSLSAESGWPATHLARRWSLGMALLLASVPVAAAQGTDPGDATAASGVVLSYGASVAKPLLGEGAANPFGGLGEIRAGPGVQLGLGYAIASWELTATADLAGLEIGEPIESDGIAMGRESLILRAAALTVAWRPAGGAWRGWRPLVVGGVVWESLDNVMMRADQLPPEVRDSDPADGAVEAQPAGVEGTGGRLEVGAARTLMESLGLRLTFGGDYVRLRDLTFGGARLPWQGGTGWVPRAAATLRWTP